MSGNRTPTRLLISHGLLVVLAAGCDSRSPKPPATPSPASQPAATGPRPRIEAEDPIFDIGRRWSTEPPIRHDFVLKNSGEATLEIKGVVSSCGCTTVGAKQVKLEPGETWKLPVELDLKTQKPLVAHRITVYSNDPQQGKLELKIRGFIRAPVVISPRNAHFFGQIDKDATRTHEAVIKNQTDEAMDLKVARSDGETFTAKIEAVTPGKEYKLIMTARPPYKSGVTVGKIELSTGLTREPTLEIRPQVYVPPRLMVVPSRLTVAQPLPVGAREVVSVRNNGDTDVKVTGVTTGLEGVTTEIRSLREGKIHNIDIRLPNGLKIPAGGGELIIRTDDKEMPELKVQIYGQGPVTTGPAATGPAGPGPAGPGPAGPGPAGP
ncbi:MAG: DUF1573 domain-containing protein [Phycisphaerae bacterium]|nr:DUF1573 domain-containing protein [Phycisphaerae bacterium]